MSADPHSTDRPVPAEPAKSYMRTQVGTASQQRLICILHEQCAYALRQAIGSDTPLRRPYLDKVQNVLVLLQRALKLTDNTAQGLFHLYDYCYCLCEHSGIPELTRALSITEGLRQTFDRLQKHP
jgi:flagellin-specific chaperone FliS